MFKSIFSFIPFLLIPFLLSAEIRKTTHFSDLELGVDEKTLALSL